MIAIAHPSRVLRANSRHSGRAALRSLWTAWFASSAPRLFATPLEFGGYVESLRPLPPAYVYEVTFERGLCEGLVRRAGALAVLPHLGIELNGDSCEEVHTLDPKPHGNPSLADFR